MFLRLCFALLGNEDESSGEGSVCRTPVLSDEDASDYNTLCAEQYPRYPYYDGSCCVSCSTHTGGTQPFFDYVNKRCVSGCPDEAPIADENRVCQPCPNEKPYSDYYD